MKCFINCFFSVNVKILTLNEIYAYVQTIKQISENIEYLDYLKQLIIILDILIKSHNNVDLFENFRTQKGTHTITPLDLTPAKVLSEKEKGMIFSRTFPKVIMSRQNL